MQNPLIEWRITTDPRTVNATCGSNNYNVKSIVKNLREKYNGFVTIEYRIPDGKWIGLWVLRGSSQPILEAGQKWLIQKEKFYLSQFTKGLRDMENAYPPIYSK
jgi:hypothetical protein